MLDVLEDTLVASMLYFVFPKKFSGIPAELSEAIYLVMAVNTEPRLVSFSVSLEKSAFLTVSTKFFPNSFMEDSNFLLATFSTTANTLFTPVAVAVG